MNERQLLMMQAAELVKLGYHVEEKRNTLRRLVEAGVEYSSWEMLCALDEFNLADQEWKALEQKHLTLRKKLTTED